MKVVKGIVFLIKGNIILKILFLCISNRYCFLRDKIL